MFKNRSEAGHQLVAPVCKYLLDAGITLDENLAVVATSNGGVIVANELAHAFHRPIEKISVRPIPFPDHPQYPIGAVTGNGTLAINPNIPHSKFWGGYIDYELCKLEQRCKAMDALYYSYLKRERIDLREKNILLVSDGIVTGLTQLVLIKMLEECHVNEIYVATPVISVDAKSEIAGRAKQLIAVRVVDDMEYLSDYYHDFAKVDSDKVRALAVSSEDFAAANFAGQDLGTYLGKDLGKDLVPAA